MSQFSCIIVAKMLKNSYCLLTEMFRISQKGKKTKRQKRNQKIVWHFLWLRKKINNWKVCYRQISAVYLKRFILSVRTKSITENFVNCRFVMIQCIFSLQPYQETYFTTFFRNGSYFFSKWNKDEWSTEWMNESMTQGMNEQFSHASSYLVDLPCQ